MSRISDQIRDAALGPTPDDDTWLRAWLPFGETFNVAYDMACDGKCDFWNKRSSTRTRRTFLLLVAEALS